MEVSDAKKFEEIKSILETELEIDLLSNTRKRPIVEGRMIFTKIVKDNFKRTYEYIGDFINKDHSNIIHYLKKFNNYFETDSDFKEKYHRCLDEVNKKMYLNQLTPEQLELIEQNKKHQLENCIEYAKKQKTRLIFISKDRLSAYFEGIGFVLMEKILKEAE